MKITKIFQIYLSLNFAVLCSSRVLDIFDALDKSLIYASTNNVTLNLILGVAIAEGQIQEILSSQSAKRAKDVTVLQNMLKRCDAIREKRKELNAFFMPHSQIVQKAILEPKLWKNYNFGIKKLQLSLPNDGVAARMENLEDYLKIADFGEPTEFNSERCLAEILNARRIFISTECLDVMYPNKPSHGYHLTHKLLFFTILEKLNMTGALPMRDTMSAILSRTCSKILDEMSLIQRLKYPEILRDLLMEQVFLCGFHGFSEFLSDRVIIKIMEWNTRHGYFSPYTGNHTGSRGDDHFAEVNHMTGLGIALLGLIGKIAYV